MASPISTSERSVNLPSPDGRWVATIEDAQEIAMSAPTQGELRVGTLTVENCNPSMVWSEDSCYLAVPKWIWTGHDAPKQRVMIVCPGLGWVRHAPGTFAVVALERFQQGIVYGTNSPYYQPRPLRIDVNILIALKDTAKKPRRPST